VTEKPLVLLVDDQTQNTDLLEAHLMPLGYEVLIRASGEEALEAIASHSVDLVLLDVMMPGMDGFEVCRRIKKDPASNYIPIILLTALTNLETKISGLEAGADDFLNKPFHKIELVARVSNLLKIKFLRDDVELRNQLISNMLHRYVNNKVIEQILTNPDKYSELGGHRKEVAVFFCDIRGFTSLSENLDADELIQLLNSIYKELTGVVFRNKGTFDKYIGDCIMAFWGAPTDVENETLWAVRAGVEMQEAFSLLRQGWPADLKTLGLGIGIHFGEVVVGNIGTHEAMDYTVIGDVVNTAQRIESVALRGQILISKKALERVKGDGVFEALPPILLKGKTAPVEIFSVKSVKADTEQRPS